MRKIIISLGGVLILVLAVVGFKLMTKEKEVVKPKKVKVVQSVMTQKITNTSIALEVSASGSLSAKNKMDIYAEVQGVFERTGKEFKPGISYAKGQTLVKINSSEFSASISAKKSALYNTISSIMPDLKLDYPESFSNWQNYLYNLDVNAALKPLPIYVTDREKYFVSGKNISVQYYEIKNLEEKLRKYSVYAPYSGVLTSAMVNTGTLVRAGQKIGEFIDPSVYELEISLSEIMASYLKIGHKVVVINMDGSKEWTGFVIRKNAILESSSQTKKVFIKLKGKDLSDGMYLKAFIKGKNQEDVIELDRSLLIDDQFVYTISKDSILKLKEVNIIHFNGGTAIVNGLKDGEMIISKLVPGAYDGMEVKVITH
jgi:membrane fusion protein (multidrug efflux system)